jgi:hypothetical protein
MQIAQCWSPSRQAAAHLLMADLIIHGVEIILETLLR